MPVKSGQSKLKSSTWHNTHIFRTIYTCITDIAIADLIVAIAMHISITSN